MGHPNRRLSNRYVRHFMQAIEVEMGAQSLRMVLHQSGMERYVGQLPPCDSQAVAYASEMAALQQAIQAYYGHGARGSLNRIGRATWRRMVIEASPGKKLRLLAIRLLPRPGRPLRVLQEVIAEMRAPDGDIQVQPAPPHLMVVDRACDFSHGVQRDENICWVTQGMIQEALTWATGQDYEVEEIACKATGADACRFRITAPEA